MSDETSAPIRMAPTRRLADEWALVLTSEGLHPAIQRTRDGFDIEVPEAERERADAALCSYALENPPRPPAQEVPPPTNLVAGALLSLVWIAFFRVTGPRDPTVEWFARGSADAASIIAGEFWRASTALTLHADLGHALGNALAGTLFIGSVFGALGIGLGFASVVCTGVLGNLANAAFHSAQHSSVGASTAIFGAVGMLAALSVGRHRRLGIAGRRALAPIAAGLALLAMLGTSERADLSGHIFGLIAGLLLGIPCARVPLARPGPIAQWLFGTGAMVWLLSNWSVALP